MKHWQTRGEVQDSDEEELGLEELSQSPEHPRKKVKVAHSEDAPSQDGNTKQTTQSSDALPATNGVNGVSVYGKFEEKSHGLSDRDLLQAARQEKDDEPIWTNPIAGNTYGRLQRISKQRDDKAKDLVPVIPQAERNAVDMEDVQATYEIPSSGSLPLNPIASTEDVASPFNTAASTTPKANVPPADDISSRASSPLSELSDPPDSPLIFLDLPDSSRAQNRETTDTLPAADRNDEIVDIDGHGVPASLLTQGARRSLRARQEKQLHPYMYDRAQYQQQCRERGLKPVRLMEQVANETQDASNNQDSAEPTSSAACPSSSSSSFAGPVSSGVQVQESFNTDSGNFRPALAEDELPDIDDLLRNRTYTAHAKKREQQKVTHKGNGRSNHTAQPESVETTKGIFSVPPSPPLSSRDSAPGTLKRPRGFKLPRGLSPVPLPTPQISSEMRPSHTVEETNLSDEDTPPRTARRFTRVRSAIAVPSESSSSSGSDSEDDQKSLLRERRRIKGVLPASWLNIDRKAQPAQLSNDHSEHRPLATQSAPQKGVARMIQKRSTAYSGHNLLEISDGGESSESDNSLPAATERRGVQPEIPEHPDVRNDPLYSDDMGVDWVDPMLAGASRPRSSSKAKSKRQSRITDTMNEHSMPDFSEERIGLRQMQRSKSTKRGRTTTHKKPNPRPSKRLPRLSILDAPKSPTRPDDNAPPFIRLAVRQARREPARGRHSPTGKVIRLATAEETEQANLTLESWRQGRIAQRHVTHTEARQNGPDDTEKGEQSGPRTPHTNGANSSINSAKRSVPRRLALKGNGSRDGSRASLNPQKTTGPQKARPQDPGQHDAISNQRLRRPLTARAVQPSSRYRGAQLETPESAYMQENRATAFQRRIQCLTEAVVRRATTPAPGELQMTRFLDESNRHSQTRNAASSDHLQSRHEAASESFEAGPSPVRLPHKTRKRHAQRVDIETREYRQPSEPLPIVMAEHGTDHVSNADSGLVLRGLGPSGTRYATDFDIRHLPLGTYFHQSTFIGSGDLAAAVTLSERDMERASGSIRIYINGTMHEWNAWSEEVSTAMAEIAPAIYAALQVPQDMALSSCESHVTAVTSNVDHMLRSTVRYLSNCLYFLDAIDRKTCCLQLDQVIQDVLDLADDTDLWTTGPQKLRRRIIQYALVLARQSQIISDGLVSSGPLRLSTGERLRKTASRLTACMVPGELNNLRSEYEEQRVAPIRERGIRDDDSTLSGVVILHHCLHIFQNPRSMFWEVVGKALETKTTKPYNAADIDAAWHNMFTILPCLDFDSAGIIQRRGSALPDMDWSLPRGLVERCLELYPNTSTVRGTSMNEYVRATLKRCSRLFSTWRWWKCESLLSVVYDFFARRSLSLLYREEGKGSPEFLNNLTAHRELQLDVEADDRSFSIFLKILAAALRTWREQNVYQDKKIGGIAWRIIPNHARIYRKDAEVRHTDLDALRNHFDLLCTLYFASPPSHRLHVNLLRNLVDHSTSHREACRISVRAWSRLASFQTSTSEATDALEPFIEWFKDMTQTTIAQYRFARTEAEQQYSEAKAQGAIGISDELLEQTVASNQRQIAATVVDLLAAFRRALTSASSLDSARVILAGCEPWKAFDSFDPSERRLTAVYNECIDLAKATIDVQNQLRSTLNSQDPSEDSQDYGDFSLLQEFATGQASSQIGDDTDLVELVHEPCAQLLSNAFGSEVSPDDTLLARLVEVWMQLANYMVNKGLRTWSNFVNDYNAGAWFQLRDTTQHRKFTPYLLAKVLDNDPNAFDSLKQTILATWLKSLVERESTLKHQHLLTAALLNVESDESLLQNLPFSKMPANTKYQITLQELRQGRLGLISTVLSNMLQQYDKTLVERPQALPELKRSYSDLLRQLMQAMKSNYQDLQLGSPTDTADSSVQGTYVIFVQQVVTFLQQYTNDYICAVDRFFLDSSAFPLPAADPTYVVGRLRSNGTKLGEAKTRKKVATFLHAVSERAAIDGQQGYLADQFYRAMAGTTELGDVHAPSLRHVILSTIFPLYIESALDDSCAWILALPMLVASAKAVDDLRYDTILGNEDSITAALEVMGALLGAVQTSIGQIFVHEQKLKSPRVLKTAAAMLELCRAAVAFAHHIQRSSVLAASVLNNLRMLEKQSIKLEKILTRKPENDDFFFCDSPGLDLMEIDEVIDPPILTPAIRWPETHAFSARQLQQSMASDWHSLCGEESERVFVRRGNGSKEIAVQMGPESVEKEGLMQASAAFRKICDAQRMRGGTRRRVCRGDFGLGGLVI